MNKKGIALVVGIIAIITLLLIGGGKSSSVLPDDSTNSVGKTKVAHVFVEGTHIYTGEINLPTPCHTLQHRVAIAESYPEQVTATFEMKSDVDACVQMVTPEPFVVSFDASEEANFRITLNDKDFPFEVIEVQSVIEEMETEKATTTEEETEGDVETEGEEPETDEEEEEENIPEEENATSTDEESEAGSEILG